MTYAERVAQLEAEGITSSDAQGMADYERAQGVPFDFDPAHPGERQGRRGMAWRGTAWHGGPGWAGKDKMTGTELKTLRYKLGLSLAQASRQVEVSARAWCRWEAGERPVPEGAAKLFKLLNKVS